MLEIASQIIICLLLAALIGFIIGYIVAKGTSKKPEAMPENEKLKKTKENTKPKATKAVSQKTIVKETIEKDAIAKNDSVRETAEEEIEIPTAEATQNAVEAPEDKENTIEKPELLTQAREGKKDSLTQIKGIGPKVEEKLNEAGIYHFSQIANWTEPNIHWLELNTAFAHRAKKDLWVNQAKSLV